MIEKRELRKEILKVRDALSAEERRQKSEQITRRVIEQNKFQNANKVLLFSSFRSEVDTEAIFKEAKRLNKDIYYPRVIGQEMEFYLVNETTEFEVSRFGIKEPKVDDKKVFSASEEDKVFILVPGAAFDEDGNRIGYGGGYYDKYLEQLEEKISDQKICKIAVAFECQMVEKGKIYSESYDIKPDYIVTEDRVIAVE